MDKINSHRRKILLSGMAAAGLTLLPGLSEASVSASRPRILTLNNLHTGESLRAEFFNGRSYNQEELVRLNHFFRDYRCNQVKTIDPHLFDQLYRLQVMLGTRKPVQLISGYRSLATNNRLRETGDGVAKHSYHTRGQAMDFHIEGLQLTQVRAAALKLRAGGVGYYPKSNFIHIDTGPVRHWS